MFQQKLMTTCFQNGCLLAHGFNRGIETPYYTLNRFNGFRTRPMSAPLKLNWHHHQTKKTLFWSVFFVYQQCCILFIINNVQSQKIATGKKATLFKNPIPAPGKSGVCRGTHHPSARPHQSEQSNRAGYCGHQSHNHLPGAQCHPLSASPPRWG
ncbi:hypothetical protein SAMN05444008_1148 [Cnuella takakiae]|uniref:Uncharacterized protein n=1 Tax=Cnuella takakiae TaxID=1302690 RepID=A0A1M5FHA2_9BACT|nr:hypothetical protein SAMN05444008_1148 [Cnuella takakiae]